MKKILPCLIGGVLGILLTCVVNIGLEPTPGIVYNCDGEEKELIETYLSYNDDRVIDLLKTYNTTINVKDEVYSNENTPCLGYIQMSNKMITLDIEKGNIEDVTNHEIGHLVDYEYTDKVLSLEDDFCEIYVKEQWWFDDYNGGCSSECFAQSYKYYVEGDLDFKENCPGLWEYMNTLLKGVA